MLNENQLALVDAIEADAEARGLCTPAEGRPPMARQTCAEGCAYTVHMRGGAPISVRRCALCGEIDFGDLAGQAEKIRAEERERILGTPDEPTGILDRYEVKAYIAPNGKPLHMVYCGRCPHMPIWSTGARGRDGDQSGVTLAELAEWAMDHEEEEHAEPAGSSSPESVEATHA